MLSATQIKARLNDLRRGPAHYWGQNFLISDSVQRRIIEAALGRGRRRQLLEIGPGLGVLTAELAAAADLLVAVERDPDFAAALPGWLNNPPSLKVVPADIVRFDPSAWFTDNDYDLVSNLPFQVSNFVLWHYLTRPPPPRRITVMLQREVADRLLADPGRRERAPISVLTELYAESRVVCQVPSGAFWPAPKVTATVVQLEIKRPIEPGDKALYRLIKAGFQNRRKTLTNNFTALLGEKQAAIDLLERSKINPMARAEALSLQEWQICSSNCNIPSAITEAEQ